MAHRSTLSLAAFALVFSVSGVAQAQHRRHHPRVPRHAPAAAAAHQPASQGAARMHEDGALGAGEPDGSGRYAHARSMNLTRGDAVTFAASSSEFDVVVRARSPRGNSWEDDDGAGNGTDARLRFVAPESGRYLLTVTSYGEGETGDFSADLAVEHGGVSAVSAPPDAQPDAQPDDQTDAPDVAPDDAPSDDVPHEVPSSEGGTTYGIFVGITHYRGENDDLPGTAADAQHLAQSFEHAGWMDRRNAVVLTDENATFDRVRQAFAALAPRVGPRDMFVFFFDGHGNADEVDLRGRDMTRRDLSRLLDSVHGRSLVVLDSCNAGGFASVVQGHADRAGLFSSRADEESSVASAVGSGGWLAWHFRRAVDGGVRRGPDGSIDFGAVSRYVQAQYRQSRVADQHLVAVRGDRRGDFAIGGASDGSVPAMPDNVAVARNDPQPSIPDAPTADPWNGADPTGQFPSADAFGQAMNMGVGLATGVLQAITK